MQTSPVDNNLAEQYLTPHSSEQEKALLEVCGVLDVSVGALRVIQNVLAGSVKEQGASLHEWEKKLIRIREQMTQFIAEFSDQLAHSQQIAFEQQQLSLADYNALLSETLAHSVDTTLFVSKRAIMMVYMMDEVMSALSGISAFVDQVKSINKQANMLAVNASIEAVRAGQAGQNFAVVAREVKQIAEDIKELSGGLHKQIRDISENVTAASGVLEEVATVDLNAAVANKEKMDDMLDRLVAQQKSTAHMLGGKSEEHELMLASLQSIISSLQKSQPDMRPLCSGLDEIAERQCELKKSLEVILQNPDTPPDQHFAESVAKSFAQPNLEELLSDALAGKEIALSLAMQNIRHIPHIIKE